MPAPPLTVLDESEQLFHDSVLTFAQREIQPRIHAMEAEAAIPADLVTRLVDLGLLGIEVPETHGGAGASFFHAILAVEALSRVDPAVALLADVHNTLVVRALRAWGTGAQQARLLPRLASDTVGAYALSEAQSGSDAFALATRAVATEGGYRLTGRKLWVSNAAEAGLFVVFATVNPDAGHRGITAFLVESGAQGLTVGRREHKLGLRASSTCEVLFDDCHISRDAVLGEPGLGYKVAIESLNAGRIGIGAQMVGIATAALEHALTYTQTRQQFGQPVGAFQGVQFQLARAAMEVEAARLLVFNAARLCDAARPFVKEAAMCKLYASEVAERITSLAVNLFGGNGVTSDYPVEKLYRDAKVGQIYEGTSNMQLMTIARQLQA